MDSANSGSLQSSSGGDDEYDSRADPISSPFLHNHNSSSLFSSLSNHQPPPTLFDPINNLHPFSHQHQNQNQNPLYNLDLAWARNLRSEPNFTDFTSLNPFQSSTTSSSSTSTQSLIGVQALNQGPFPSPSIDVANATKPLQSDQTNAPKNPKKRTRASRRAPTTVLTTDTTNFRQMVQEFTGIPAAPFSGTTYSRRLDLFGSGPAMRSTTHIADTLGPLYRPSPQKYATSSSSSSSPSFFLSPANITNSSSVVVGGTSSSDHLQKESQSLLNMQNPILAFQQQSQNLLGVEHVSGFHASGDATTQVRESDTLTRWRDGGDGGGHYGNNNNNNNSSSDFNHGNGNGKSLENVVSSSSRGEGTVDSWIIPSD